VEKANVNGAELEYEVEGSGEPVLLIGTGPIADSFLPLLSERALVERYRLITYRQRRLGGGANGAAAVSFAEHAADAAALLGYLGIHRAHVAGHSTGAVITLQLAVAHPDVVHSLALLEPLLLGVPSAGAFLEQAGPALAAYGSGDRNRSVAAFLSMVSGLDWPCCREVIDQYVPGGVARAMKDADNTFGSYLPALQAWQFGPDQAAAVSQPLLSVLGAETQPLFVDGAELLRAWFPPVEECRIEDVGHLLHMQRPEPVARGLAEFFGRHPMTRSETRPAASPLTAGGRQSRPTPV
jgi:pimeloyl-ACP methyl ester carboxylesterase